MRHQLANLDEKVREPANHRWSDLTAINAGNVEELYET